MHTIMYDLRFRTPFTCVVSGASQSGKTTFVFSVIKDREAMFDCAPDRCILYFYNVWQPIFEELEKENIVTEWIKGLPSRETLHEKTAAYKDKKGSLVSWYGVKQLYILSKKKFFLDSH